MIPILVPVALVSFAVYAYRKHKAKPLALPAPAPPSTTSGFAGASPLAVLDHYVRAGKPPPPFVIESAIAHAQAIGRMDLAARIVQTFIVPVLRQHEAAAPATPSQPQEDDGGDRAPVRVEPVDPTRMRGYVDPSEVSPETIDVNAFVDGLGDAAAYVPPADPGLVSPSQPLPPSRDDRGDAGTTTVSGRSSPIAGIDSDEWREFVHRVEREPSSFATPRHVGRFRQRRDRLAELGIDPTRVINAPTEQERALEADMKDAYKHAKASGLVDEYLQTAIPIENKEHPISLSGLLGLIQAAGLEGAYEWLEKPADRKRFPHTTAMFLKTNGVF